MKYYTAYRWALADGDVGWVRIVLVDTVVFTLVREFKGTPQTVQSFRFATHEGAQAYAVGLTERYEREGYSLMKRGIWSGLVKVDLPALEEEYRLGGPVDNALLRMMSELDNQGQRLA